MHAVLFSLKWQYALVHSKDTVNFSRLWQDKISHKKKLLLIDKIQNLN